jgi:thiol reductant ABC exporter CydC subunit
VSPLGRVIRLVAPSWWRFVVSVAMGTLTVCSGIGLLAASGVLIARASTEHTLAGVGLAVLAVRVLALVRPVSRYGDRLWSHDFAFRSLGRIRTHVFEGIEPLAPAGLEGYRHGELLNRMVADVDELQNLTLRVLVPPTVALMSGAVVVAGVALVLPAAALVLAAGLIAGATVVPLIASRLSADARAHQASARSDLTADLVELLSAAPELLVFGADTERVEAVREDDRKLVRLASRDAIGAGAADGLSALVAGLTLVGVLVVAVSATTIGVLPDTAVVPLALVTLVAFEVVAALPAAAQYLSSTTSSGIRVLDLLDRPAPVSDPADPAPPPGAHPGIALEGVEARYSPHEDLVLRGGSLSLPAGAQVAVVGPSGSGKTTLTHILVRFLEREGGEAQLDGHDLRDYRQFDVRRAVTLSGQSSHIFSSTVRENLRIAQADASDDELREALARARLLDFVDTLPDGLDTRVGELGRELSGGQRQRLALARAFLADAPVLVLDEPTAHLDRRTADALLDDLITQTGERSLLLVTHHPGEAAAVGTTIAIADGVLGEGDSALPNQ